MDLIKIAEQAFATKNEFPDFIPGDTVTVAYRIKEGNKERIQQYRGVVIKINGEGDKKRFTVRKISDGIGVERIFPMDSPFIDNVSLPRRRLEQASCKENIDFFETATACVAVFFIGCAVMKINLPKELSVFSLSWEDDERLPVLQHS